MRTRSELLERAEAISRRIARALGGRSVGTRWRDHVAGAFQFVSLEHHSGVIGLFRQGRLASGMALIRPQFEAHLRGFWVLTSATEPELERFSTTGALPTTETMVEHVEGRSLALRVVKNEIWPVMCDYTHTGLRAVTRTMKQGSLGFNYSNSELLAAVQASNALAMLAGDLLAAMTGDAELRERFQHDALAELRLK